MDIVDQVICIIQDKLKMLDTLEEDNYQKHANLSDAQLVLQQLYSDTLYLIRIRDRDKKLVPTSILFATLNTLDKHRIRLRIAIDEHLQY